MRLHVCDELCLCAFVCLLVQEILAMQGHIVPSLGPDQLLNPSLSAPSPPGTDQGTRSSTANGSGVSNHADPTQPHNFHQGPALANPGKNVSADHILMAVYKRMAAAEEAIMKNSELAKSLQDKLAEAQKQLALANTQVCGCMGARFGGCLYLYPLGACTYLVYCVGG